MQLFRKVNSGSIRNKGIKTSNRHSPKNYYFFELKNYKKTYWLCMHAFYSKTGSRYLLS